MTPKEKAQELVDKFIPFADTYHYGNLANAKQCALIAVDEILKLRIAIPYWQEVKQEIEAL